MQLRGPEVDARDNENKNMTSEFFLGHQLNIQNGKDEIPISIAKLLVVEKKMHKMRMATKSRLVHSQTNMHRPTS